MKWFILILWCVLLNVEVAHTQDVTFENIAFLETNPARMGDKAKKEKGGALFRVNVTFKDSTIFVIGKERRYAYITNVPYKSVSRLRYDYVDRKKIGAGTIAAAVLINPALIFAAQKEQQHWLKIQYQTPAGEGDEITFLLEHDVQMSFKWLIQARSGRPIESTQNGETPPTSLRPGMTVYEVLNQLGDPLKVLEFGDKTIFYYEARILGFEAKLIFERGVLKDLM